MKVAVFNTKTYDQQFLEEANQTYQHELVFLEPRLTLNTYTLAENYPAVCVFVHDELDAEVLIRLSQQGTKLIALRCAGFNNVDIVAAEDLGFTVVRVPAYSPYAVAEHTVALILALNRKIHRAYARVREANFALEGLLGFDLRGKTLGVIGTGKIGRIVLEIMKGFGCHLLAYDVFPNGEITAMGAAYVDLPTLLSESDIVSLHCPLTPETYHLIDSQAMAKMKKGVMLINTSRGALVDTSAAIEAIKNDQLGYLGLDVYEEEDGLFFEDLSNRVIKDDVFSRLLTFPNVIVTGHQAFFTENALHNIADTTLANISEFEKTGACRNSVGKAHIKK